jgi:hypothetical protein
MRQPLARRGLSPRGLTALAGLAALAAALGGCSSSRLGDGIGARAATRPAPTYSAPLEPVAPAAPSGAVSSAPLAPPPGAAAAPDDAFGAGIAAGPIVAEPAPPPVQQQASIAPPPIAPPAPSGRSSVVGGWNAREASGASCRVQLSSSPALDLYKASATGCANRDLARVTAWDYREGEVYLYQPGGTVAARLRSGGGGLEGVIAKSGAPLTLQR